MHVYCHSAEGCFCFCNLPLGHVTNQSIQQPGGTRRQRRWRRVGVTDTRAPALQVEHTSGPQVGKLSISGQVVRTATLRHLPIALRFAAAPNANNAGSVGIGAGVAPAAAHIGWGADAVDLADIGAGRLQAGAAQGAASRVEPVPQGAVLVGEGEGTRFASFFLKGYWRKGRKQVILLNKICVFT